MISLFLESECLCRQHWFCLTIWYQLSRRRWWPQKGTQDLHGQHGEDYGGLSRINTIDFGGIAKIDWGISFLNSSPECWPANYVIDSTNFVNGTQKQNNSLSRKEHRKSKRVSTSSIHGWQGILMAIPLYSNTRFSV